MAALTTFILFNQVIQIVNLAYFSKTDQTKKDQQNVNILQSGIVAAAYITVLGKHEINSVAELIYGSNKETHLPLILI